MGLKLQGTDNLWGLLSGPQLGVEGLCLVQLGRRRVKQSTRFRVLDCLSLHRWNIKTMLLPASRHLISDSLTKTVWSNHWGRETCWGRESSYDNGPSTRPWQQWDSSNTIVMDNRWWEDGYMIDELEDLVFVAHGKLFPLHYRNEWAVGEEIDYIWVCIRVLACPY